MPVLFAKTFVHAGHQLLVQRRLVPVFTCACGNPNCRGLELLQRVVIQTIIPGSEIELVFPLRGADDTPAAAQQLVDLFELPDAIEALEILQASFYKIENLQESEARLEALRTSLLTRISAIQ